MNPKLAGMKFQKAFTKILLCFTTKMVHLYERTTKNIVEHFCRKSNKQDRVYNGPHNILFNGN